MIDITQKLLLLHRADSGKLLQDVSTIHLSPLLEIYTEELAAFHPKITVDMTASPDLHITGDLQLIKQLLGNVFSNAVKYNTPHGWIKITLAEAPGAVILTIANQARALSEAFSGQVFERFYRGGNSRSEGIEGHGLGLSICQEICHVHNAEITALASDNIFKLTVQFPAAQSPA